jgi:hypothetical protein
VKGILKDAAVTIAKYKDNKEEWEEFVDRVFGVKAEKNSIFSEEGSSSFSDAQLSKNMQQYLTRAENENKIAHLCKSISSTAIDENGVAKEHSLRRIEYVIPVTLYGTIDDIKPNDKEKMLECFKMVKSIGSGRNRGFGRCIMSEFKGDKND